MRLYANHGSSYIRQDEGGGSTTFPRMSSQAHGIKSSTRRQQISDPPHSPTILTRSIAMPLQRTPPQLARAGPSEPTEGPNTTSVTIGSLPSPSRAFQPRNPGVLRTPPTGGAVPAPAAAQDESASMEIDEVDGTIELAAEPEVDAVVVAGPSTTPRSVESRTPILDARTIQPMRTPTVTATSAVLAAPNPLTRTPAISATPAKSATHAKSATPAAPTASYGETKSTPGPSTSLGPTTPARTPRSTPKDPFSEPRPTMLADVEDEMKQYGKRVHLTMDTLNLALRAGASRWT